MVSIHAPVMGAKYTRPYSITHARVSIHAPVMGANSSLSGASAKSGFNPRTRDGCEEAAQLEQTEQVVSIHAPVMGANFKRFKLY